MRTAGASWFTRTAPYRVALGVLVAAATTAFAATPTADCSGGRFSGTEPYSLDDYLPFDFHQPAAWEAHSETSSHQIVSVSKPQNELAIGAVAVSMDLMVSLQRDRYPEMTEDLWQQTMDLIAEVPYADEALTIYSPTHAIMAKFLVPYDGSRYQVSINFGNGEFCPAEAMRLRDLFIETVTPNDNTRFQAR